MADYQIGDTVRITYEGRIAELNRYGEIALIGGGSFHVVEGSTDIGTNEPVGKVEVLKRRKPKVGDKTTVEFYSEALAGTIVKNAAGYQFVRMGNGQWVGLVTGHAYYTEDMARAFEADTIAYLPEDQS